MVKRHVARSTVVAAAGLVVALTGALPAEARIGVTAAVVPETEALRPGNPLEPLVLGADIDFDEHIVTAADGRAQILFLDHSTLSVGPNADVVIDKFVYSPQEDSGSLAISATKGVLRYIGGALSKHEDAVKIETPTAIIGIRGGIALVEVEASGATHATFLYGKELTITARDGGSLHITRPGFTSSVGVGELHPSTPVKANPTQIATATAATTPLSPAPAATTTAAPSTPASAPATPTPNQTPTTTPTTSTGSSSSASSPAASTGGSTHASGTAPTTSTPSPKTATIAPKPTPPKPAAKPPVVALGPTSPIHIPGKTTPPPKAVVVVKK